MTESKLLDLNDCSKSYKKIYKEILKLDLLKNPKWLRYLLEKSFLVQKYIGYNHWSRAWEYPWAIYGANIEKRCRILDVGGGGSPFADYLSKLGHDSYVIDPSLRDGKPLQDEPIFYLDKNKSLFRNLQLFIFRTLKRTLKIHSVEGIHSIHGSSNVKYFPQKANCIDFPDNYFDRVFCLSVMEHIPKEEWNKCIQEFERVLKMSGRLVITLDMTLDEANERLYMKLIDYSSLTLIGNPHYKVPISKEDRIKRHGHFYETIGLVWQA